MSESDTTMLQQIKANVHEVEPEAEVWLYGSRARGDAHEESDWDVLVLSPKSSLSTKEEGVFIDHMTDLMITTGQVIHLFAYGKNDWHSRHSITPFYQNIQHEAIRL
ncbi:MAG: nucleotidyltransferase domain-containing protein [Bacteroidales bacterium]|nr:nucleotidyltransferase domain-containing protein [Bacteroidales bacterium]